MKNVSDIYPLTPTQGGILYHTLRSQKDEVYYQQIRCMVSGVLDVDKFRQAWDEVVSCHPALRTIFLWEGIDEPLQVVRQTVTVPWDIIDWRGMNPEEQDERLAALSQEYRQRGFDLSKAPILRMVLIQVTDDQYHFIWNFHHLLTDGWSTHLVFYEAINRYESMVTGVSYNPDAAPPFRNFVDWLIKQDNEQAERYWRKQLGDFSTPTPFYVDKPVKQEAIKHGESTLSLDAETTIALRNIARQHRLTLNTIIQGAWSLLLSRYSGEVDVVFGVTVSNRPADLRAVDRMVGMFINTLPMRARINEDAQLAVWLQELQDQQLDMRQYEYSSLAKVQRWSGVEPGQQLFDSIVVFENYPIDTAVERSITIKDMHYREQSNYPLALLVMPGERLRLLMIYDEARFDEDTIKRMLRHLQTVLVAIVANPDQELSEIPLLDDEEYQQVMVEWNQTEVSMGPGVWVHDQITAAAKNYPEKTAVIAGTRSLSYAQLDKLANQLAHRLMRQETKPGTPVVLFVDRSPAMIVGILGILKAGCAYVPLDPSYPAQRIAFILKDTQAHLIVTQDHLVNRLDLPDQSAIVLDDEWSQISSEAGDPPIVSTGATDLAYIIYTSGSTGLPKGVTVTHRNLFTSNGARRQYYKKAVESFLLLSSFAFDSSVAGIFWTLTDGGMLVLPAPGDERDIDQLATLIARHRITHTLALPSLYRLLLDYAQDGSFDSLNTVIVAGEACPPDLAAQHYRRTASAALYNEYGPTEATVWSSVYELTGDYDQGSVPIGKPIANTRLYVLDSLNRPVPIGVPGELVIGGEGVVPGYWNRPELTSERFFPNPFFTGRVYYTGDRVRWLPDGNLEFLGRADRQIKLRGYRIEPSEIENALRQNPIINDAFVLYRNGQLTAYLKAESSEISHGERLAAVRSDIIRHLPGYMIPSAWVWLNEFPRTPNGKIDRNKLSEPESTDSDRVDSYEAAETETEKKIQAIWAELLGSKNISRRDDFFMSGGHSLLMIQLVSRLRQAFGIPIPLGAVMDVRTIAEQAQRIDVLLWNKELVLSGNPSNSTETREEFDI
jgi:amino acid adenylation domain-containing protein